jgi:hypothetical protein
VEAKNTIIKKDSFNTLHRRFLELSPSPPQQMKPDDYYSVSCIVSSVMNLLSSNPSAVIPFLNSPLIPVFSWTLESSMSLLNTSLDENIQEIFRFICGSFLQCTVFSFEDVIRFMEMKGGDLMLSVIEKYVEEIKENKKNLDEVGVENASISIYNVALFSSNESGFEKLNKMRDIFEKNNKFYRMVNLCNYLISPPPSSPEQRRITEYISLTICLLLQSERPSPSVGYTLSKVDNLKTSPRHPDDTDISKNAKKAWDGMTKWWREAWFGRRKEGEWGDKGVEGGRVWEDEEVGL